MRVDKRRFRVDHINTLHLIELVKILLSECFHKIPLLPDRLFIKCPLFSFVSSLRLARSAFFTSDLEGIQATLIHVPPYISSDCSTTATVSPALASAPASVFPPLPNPTIIESYSICCITSVYVSTQILVKFQKAPSMNTPFLPLLFRSILFDTTKNRMNVIIQRFYLVGSTGLEPATSSM